MDVFIMNIKFIVYGCIYNQYEVRIPKVVFLILWGVELEITKLINFLQEVILGGYGPHGLYVSYFLRLKLLVFLSSPSTRTRFRKYKVNFVSTIPLEEPYH